MASTLVSQLQKIAATSTNTLNTQKLKSIHSASLLFPAAHAATQDLDTVYSIALEGFRELCLIDSRFLAFERGLFEESSKGVDRFLLGRDEKVVLDRCLEGFLGVVTGWLLVRPAVRAVEWLVRRFRIQDQNTAAYILCFLPYHSHPTLFPTALSIIARKDLPHEFLFLTPYLDPPAPVPRHVITHSFSHRRDFFNLLSEHVLCCVRTNRTSHILLSFFTSISTVAISSMCDATYASGRKSLNTQDVLQRTLPILEEGFKAERAPEFMVGCYMLTTVLVGKLTLSDEVVLALMVGIVNGWNEESLGAGLATVALLAQARVGSGEEKEKVSCLLPDKLVKSLVGIEGIAERLLGMGEKYRVDKLVVGICVGVLRKLRRRYGIKELSLVIRLLQEARLAPKQSKVIVKKLITAAEKVGEQQVSEEVELVREKLADCLVAWSEQGDKKRFGKVMKEVLEDGGVDVEMLELKLQAVLRLPATTTTKTDAKDASSKNAKMIKAPPPKGPESFDQIISNFPTSTTEVTFLTSTPSELFPLLSKAFISSIANEENLNKLLSLDLLHAKDFSSTLVISLLIKIWTSSPSSFPILARATALTQCGKIIKASILSSTSEKIDYQALIPHALAALADPSERVRSEAAALLLVLGQSYKSLESSTEMFLKKKKKKRQSKTAAEEVVRYWGIDNIYGSEGGEETQNVKWLETAEARKVLEIMFLGNLEECVLDPSFVGRIIETSLSSSPPREAEKETTTTAIAGLRSSLKASVMAFLGSHVVNAPGLGFKLRLLSMLNRIKGGPAATNRTKILLPALKNWIKEDYQTRIQKCKDEKVDLEALELEMVGVVAEAGGETDGVKTLIDIIDRSIRPSLSSAAAKRIIVAWDSLRLKTKVSSAQSLLELALKEDDDDDDDVTTASTEALEVLRNSTLPTESFEEFFKESRELLKSSTTTSEGSTGNPKRRRRSVASVSADKEADVAAAVKRVTVVSELLEKQGSEKHPGLLKVLFLVLGDVGSVEFGGLAYLQGVVLSCMTAIVRSYKASETPQFDGTVRADVLVSCIRSTTSPQVQNSALLLLASLADVAPEVVKHSVMPIFTFMGANTLRQDDEYSAHVIKQTVQRVIPPLLKSLQEQGGSPVIGTAELVSTFVESYRHIPAHRRVRLFISLTETLGADECLFAVLAKLAGNLNPNDPSSADYGDVGEFCAMLAGSFSAETQLLTVVKFLNVISDVLAPSNDGISKHLFGGREEVKDRTPVQLASRLMLVLVGILGSERLRARVVKRLKDGDTDAARLREHFAEALENTHALGDNFGSRVGAETSKLLEALLNLLSTPEFVKVVEKLIEDPKSQFRRSALGTFQHRVTTELSSRSDAASTNAIFRLAPKIAAIINTKCSNKLRADAISCIDAVIVNFGFQRQPAVISTLAETVIGENGLKSSDHGLRILSLVCLTSVTTCLEGRIVPFLPKTVPFTLEILADAVWNRFEPEHPCIMIHNAGFAFLDELVKTIPTFMASYLETVLPTCYMASTRSNDLAIGEQIQIRHDFLTRVAEKMDAKTVVTALWKTWGDAVLCGESATTENLFLLEKTIDKASKSTVQKMVSTWVSFFLTALDLKRDPSSCELADTAVFRIQQACLKVLLKVVMKLNDTLFKPMFQRILWWASEEGKGLNGGGGKERLMAFWSMLGMLCDNLASLMTEYYGLALDNAVEILGGAYAGSLDSVDLWEVVLKSLFIGFSTDDRDFWQSPTYFDKIAPPLLSLLSTTHNHHHHQTHHSIETSLIPTIIELASAAQSEDHNKLINSTLLKHMRAEKPSTRLAAVKTLHALYDRMGEEWLGLLPETVPFIAELMEDDDEEVERAAQRLVGKVEEYLGVGELEAMLT